MGVIGCKNSDINNSEFTKNEIGLIDSLNQVSFALKDFNLDEAKKISQESLKKAQLINYSEGIGQAYRNLGVIYKLQGDYLESFDMLSLSLVKYEQLKNKTGIVQANNNLGNLFKELEDYNEAISYFEKIINSEYIKENSIISGKININIGNIKAKQNDFQEAINLYNKSLIIFKTKNDTINLIATYLNLGEAYEKIKDQNKALYYYQLGKELAELKDVPAFLMHIYFYIGKLKLNTNLASESLPYILTSYDIAHEMKMPQEIKEIANYLSIYYVKTGDFGKAYEFQKIKELTEIELKQIETNKAIANIKLNELHEISELKLQNRNRLIYAAFAGLLISILLIFMFYRNYKHKQKANRLLTEMDELKTQLYSNITHELRTPLTLILGPLEQMLSTEAKKKTTRKQVKMIRKNANSILSLVNQMLDLAKIEAKNIKLELVEEDINKFLRMRFTAFASLAEQKSIRYNYSLLKEKNLQKFDAAKLEKIIYNLISNAIKFTPKNEEINCYANFPKQNILELIIQDSGKGMPENEINKIFNRFHQIENSEISNIVGTGIGLALTKELVELMHGTIEAKSELGKGSRFTVTLNLGTEHLNNQEYHLIKNNNLDLIQSTDKNEFIENSDECESYRNSEIKNVELPSILIAEDHSDIREFIAENLKNCYNTEQAENGEVGFKKAIENIPDLVITDVIMPIMDGIEFCQNLKTDQRTSHIPVIMLTGKSGIDDKMKGLEIGADAYLTKPFNIKELQLRVKKLIEQRNKLRKRFTKNLKLEPKDIAITSADETFLTHALEIIEKNMSNTEFTVKHFQEECFMSRMQLFRKIKALTNQTPSEFIRTIRLKRAANLMNKDFGNIAQITFEVGFNNPSYFSKCFKELYGKLPSEYIKTRS